jgi:hypothetical protein
MMLALLLSTAVMPAAVPARPLAVMVSSRRPGSAELAATIAAELRTQLADATDVSVLGDAEASRMAKRDARECNAVVACLASFAKSLGSTSMVVGVDVAKVRGSVAVYLEAITPDQKSVQTADFSIPAENSEAINRALQKFAVALAQKVVVVEPDVPVAVVQPPPVLKPRDPIETEKEGPVDVKIVEPQRTPSPLRWVLLGVAGAATVAAVVLGVLGFTQRSTVENSLYCDAPAMVPYGDCPLMQRATRLTRAEYDRLSAGTNTAATASLLLGVVAGLAGIASIPFFVQ